MNFEQWWSDNRKKIILDTDVPEKTNILEVHFMDCWYTSAIEQIKTVNKNAAKVLDKIFEE